MHIEKDPPGKLVIKLCQKSPFFRRVCKSLHLEQMSHDYYALWHEATSAKERENVRSEYEREMRLALLVPFGVHAGEVTVIHFFMSNEVLLSFSVIVIAVAIYVGRR